MSSKNNEIIEIDSIIDIDSTDEENPPKKHVKVIAGPKDHKKRQRPQQKLNTLESELQKQPIYQNKKRTINYLQSFNSELPKETKKSHLKIKLPISNNVCNNDISNKDQCIQRTPRSMKILQINVHDSESDSSASQVDDGSDYEQFSNSGSQSSSIDEVKEITELHYENKKRGNQQCQQQKTQQKTKRENINNKLLLEQVQQSQKTPHKQTPHKSKSSQKTIIITSDNIEMLIEFELYKKIKEMAQKNQEVEQQRKLKRSLIQSEQQKRLIKKQKAAINNSLSNNMINTNLNDQCQNEQRQHMLKQGIEETFKQYHDPNWNPHQNPYSILTLQELDKRTDSQRYIAKLLSHHYEFDDIKQKKENRIIPNTFKNARDYKIIWEHLQLNESIASIENAIDQASKIAKKCKQSDEKPLLIRPINQNGNQKLVSFEIKYQNANPIQADAEGRIDLVMFKHNIILVSSQSIFEPLLFKKYQSQHQHRNFMLMGYLQEQDGNLLNDSVSNSFTKQNGNSVSQRKQNKQISKMVLNVHINHAQLKKYFSSSTAVSNGGWVEVYMQPVEKISTQIREYVSLQNLEFMDISRAIYQPQIYNMIKIDQEKQDHLQCFFSRIRTIYNRSQTEAITAICSKSDGIHLLQGPPGTGKTFTLVGILSGILLHLQQSKNNSRKQIMICAPSNAAIDEIIMRLATHGLYNENAILTRKFNLVRLGLLSPDTHEKVKQFSLDYLTFQQIQKNNSSINGNDNFVSKNELSELIQKSYAKLSKLKQQSMQEEEQIQKERNHIRKLNDSYQQLKNNKVQEKERFVERQKEILASADVICCTLGSAQSEKLSFLKDHFDTLIIDEACQCTEPTALIPLLYNIKRVVLIGDPQQLPATTFSSNSNLTKYNRSLFERILHNGFKPHFLNEQYRMDPAISQFPSQQFYQNKLVNALQIQSREWPSWLQCIKGQNYFFFDLPNSVQTKESKSFKNITELKLAIQIFGWLDQLISQEKITHSEPIEIGFISPYKAQVLEFQKIMRDEFPKEFQRRVQISTIDSFQGQEKDIIVFSTVRSNFSRTSSKQGQDDTNSVDGQRKNKNQSKTQSIEENRNHIGFLQDERRMNVALTRARYGQIVIGNSETLATDSIWGAFVKHMCLTNKYVKFTEVSSVKVIPVLTCMFNNSQKTKNVQIMLKDVADTIYDGKLINRIDALQERHRKNQEKPKFIQKEFSAQDILDALQSAVDINIAGNSMIVAKPSGDAMVDEGTPFVNTKDTQVIPQEDSDDDYMFNLENQLNLKRVQVEKQEVQQHSNQQSTNMQQKTAKAKSANKQLDSKSSKKFVSTTIALLQKQSNNNYIKALNGLDRNFKHINVNKARESNNNSDIKPNENENRINLSHKQVLNLTTEMKILKKQKNNDKQLKSNEIDKNVVQNFNKQETQEKQANPIKGIMSILDEQQQKGAEQNRIIPQTKKIDNIFQYANLIN